MPVTQSILHSPLGLMRPIPSPLRCRSPSEHPTLPSPSPYGGEALSRPPAFQEPHWLPFAILLSPPERLSRVVDHSQPARTRIHDDAARIAWLAAVVNAVDVTPPSSNEPYQHAMVWLAGALIVVLVLAILVFAAN